MIVIYVAAAIVGAFLAMALVSFNPLAWCIGAAIAVLLVTVWQVNTSD
jgi:hypothetical protein